jgi:hypothetical protein
VQRSWSNIASKTVQSFSHMNFAESATKPRAHGKFGAGCSLRFLDGNNFSVGSLWQAERLFVQACLLGLLP